MADSTRSERRFLVFFRRYTKTWIHAVATAGLTAFGMLTFVNQGFALVAVGIYVFPPVVLYLRGVTPGKRETTEVAPVGRNDGGSMEGRTDGSDVESHDGNDDETGVEPDDENHFPSWTLAKTPVDGTLFDTVLADGDAYTVGENGVVLRDSPESDDWEIALEDGPGANGADLHGVDVTADGSAVWVAGDSGALGRFDGGTNRHVDHSAPNDITDNWTAIAVAGTEGDETILLVNGSGQVLRGRYRDGNLAWGTPTKPGSGSSLAAATLVDASVGYLCDTNDGVFEAEDGGDRFRRIGIDDVDGTLTDVAATGDGRCYVTADDGVCYRGDGGTWTPTRLDDAGLRAISVTDDVAAVCADDGVVLERRNGGEWERTVTPATGTLHGIALDATRVVSVGVDGTIVERNGE